MRAPNGAARSGGGWALRAFCLYAALIPFQPVVTLPDGSPLRIAAAELVAPLLLVAALARPHRRLAPGLGLLVLLIAVIACSSTLLAATHRPLTGYAIGKTLGLIYVTAVGCAVARGLPPGAEPRLLGALATGGFWSAVVGLVGFALWMTGHPTSLVQWERLCSTMPGDPNIYGSLLAVSLLVTLAETRRGPVARLVRLAVLGVALVLTGSRSAALAMLAGVIVLAVLRSRDRWLTAARAAYGLAVAGLVAALFVAADPGHRLDDLTTLAEERLGRTFTVESRFDLYARAYEQFSQHPIVGLGIGGFYELNDWSAGNGEHFAVHNTYLWALVDMGVAGGVLLLALVVGAIARCARAVSGPAAHSAAIVGGALAAMAVFNLFIDGYYQRHLWLLIACALGMPLAHGRRWVLASAQVLPATPVGWVEAP